MNSPDVKMERIHDFLDDDKLTIEEAGDLNNALKQATFLHNESNTHALFRNSSLSHDEKLSLEAKNDFDLSAQVRPALSLHIMQPFSM